MILFCQEENSLPGIDRSSCEFIPGVLGNYKSLEEESFVNYLLEYPQYTRPKEWKNLCIPEELLGHHQKIKIEIK